MKIRLHLIIFLFSLALFSAHAQDNTIRQLYSHAESDYEIGRVEQALDILEKNIDSFSGNLQQSAYRLMTLCLLSLDDYDRAEQCARSLLDSDPY